MRRFPRVLHDLQPIIVDNTAAPTGVVWKLADADRQLDANVLNLSARQTIATHTEHDLDVLLMIVAGSGTVTTDEGSLALAPGELVWLPHGSTRSLSAGTYGLAYVSVHRRRPGLQIRASRHPPTGGTPA